MEESSQQLQHPSPVRHHGSSGANQHQHRLLKDYSADGSGHLADSGYNSYHSINASCSVARSVLATIEEDNETADSSFEEPASARKVATSSSILTPTTTASMELISNFHLTTPKENVVAQRRTLARKPTCQNLFALRTPEKAAGNSFVETPVRSGRKSAEMGILTPRKNKTSAKRKHASFREKLYSDGDADSLENDCKKLDQEDISPIFHNKRRRNSVIDDFIRSSTPKTASFKSNFHGEAQENQAPPANRKPLVLRKFQSFSPSKMHSYRKRDTVLQEKSVLTNRRAPLQRQNAIQQTTPRKPSLETSLELSFEPTPQVANPTPSTFGALLDAPILPQPSDDLKVDLNEEVSQLPSFDDCSFTPTKPTTSSLSGAEPDSILRDASVAQSRRCSIPSILEQQLESPILFSPNIPRTPKSLRKLKRLNSSAKKEKQAPRSKPPSPKHHRVPVIPGAYRRYYDGVERLNILKRLNEHDKDAMEILLSYLADSDLVRVVAVSRGWRSIIESDRRLARRLRDYLAREAHSKENLDRSASVSRDESKLVISCDGGVVQGKLVHQSSSSSSSVVRQPFSLCNSIDAGNHSVMNTTVPKSPPVSPSRRKFHENQKIASHLKKSERLKQCPRCGKPSRVVAVQSGSHNKTIARSSSTKSNRHSAASHAAMLEKSYTLPDTNGASAVISPPPSPPPPSSSSNSPGDGSAERIRRNLFSTSSGMLIPSRACSVDGGTPTFGIKVVVGPTSRRSSSDATPLAQKVRSSFQRRRQSSSSEESQCDYAVCSGKGCGFTFCVKCLCEHHPDAVCKDLAPNSPSKEDAPVQYVACSKASRRSLRRLC